MTKADYESIPPILQADETMCWAAALEWWARVTGRPVITQHNLLVRFEPFWDKTGDPDSNANYGAIDRKKLADALAEDSAYRMNVDTVDQLDLDRAYLEPKLPCYLMYLEERIERYHAAVVYAVDDAELHLMNPDCGFEHRRWRHMFQRPHSEVVVGYPA
jgi:hypothetical protein